MDVTRTHAPVFVKQLCVSTHKLRGDCGHVSARIARTESKTETVHAPEGGFSEWLLIVIIGCK